MVRSALRAFGLHIQKRKMQLKLLTFEVKYLLIVLIAFGHSPLKNYESIDDSPLKYYESIDEEEVTHFSS